MIYTDAVKKKKNWLYTRKNAFFLLNLYICMHIDLLWYSHLEVMIQILGDELILECRF